ncbi:hypothetical protein LZK52_22900, partial [Pseudomonas aeruginosa]|nr:hypothetical protein [Pseudomonas aeruginosa]
LYFWIKTHWHTDDWQERSVWLPGYRVEVSALSDYWMDDSSVAPDDRAGLVLGFAAVPEARIDEALRALRKAWRREALVGPVVATD